MTPQPRYEDIWSGCCECKFIGSHGEYDVFACSAIDFYSIVFKGGLFAEVSYDKAEELHPHWGIIKGAREHRKIAREVEDDPSVSPNARK